MDGEADDGTCFPSAATDENWKHAG